MYSSLFCFKLKAQQAPELSPLQLLLSRTLPCKLCLHLYSLSLHILNSQVYWPNLEFPSPTQQPEAVSWSNFRAYCVWASSCSITFLNLPGLQYLHNLVSYSLTFIFPCCFQRIWKWNSQSRFLSWPEEVNYFFLKIIYLCCISQQRGQTNNFYPYRKVD